MKLGFDLANWFIDKDFFEGWEVRTDASALVDETCFWWKEEWMVHASRDLRNSFGEGLWQDHLRWRFDAVYLCTWSNGVSTLTRWIETTGIDILDAITWGLWFGFRFGNHPLLGQEQAEILPAAEIHNAFSLHISHFSWFGLTLWNHERQSLVWTTNHLWERWFIRLMATSRALARWLSHSELRVPVVAPAVELRCFVVGLLRRPSFGFAHYDGIVCATTNFRDMEML